MEILYILLGSSITIITTVIFNKTNNHKEKAKRIIDVYLEANKELRYSTSYNPNIPDSINESLFKIGEQLAILKKYFKYLELETNFDLVNPTMVLFMSEYNKYKEESNKGKFTVPEKQVLEELYNLYNKSSSIATEQMELEYKKYINSRYPFNFIFKLFKKIKRN